MLRELPNLPVTDLKPGDTVPGRGIIATISTLGADLIATFTNCNQAVWSRTARTTVHRVG
jgi:hypothetical protein